MPVEARFTVDRYVLGQLAESCGACRWWQIGHAREMPQCPLCGHGMDRRKWLTFGGLALHFDGKRVRLTAPYANCALVIDEADLPDATQFLCSVVEDRRQPGPRPGLRVLSGRGEMPDPRYWKHEAPQRGR
jgi:hypothetical protein